MPHNRQFLIIVLRRLREGSCEHRNVAPSCCLRVGNIKSRHRREPIVFLRQALSMSAGRSNGCLMESKPGNILRTSPVGSARQSQRLRLKCMNLSKRVGGAMPNGRMWSRHHFAVHCLRGKNCGWAAYVPPNHCKESRRGSYGYVIWKARQGPSVLFGGMSQSYSSSSPPGLNWRRLLI